MQDGLPVIYANDNFGHWTSDFSSLVQRCEQAGGDAARIVALIGPSRHDHSILKPRHSAFFDTPLHYLLETLRVNTLILAGTTTDSCITFTAHDAYLRQYRLWIPRDCVAAERPAWGRAALAQMQRTLNAHTASSRSGIAQERAHRGGAIEIVRELSSQRPPPACRADSDRSDAVPVHPC